MTSRSRPIRRYSTQVAITTASTARIVRSGMPFADAAAKSRSRRGASGPTARSRSSDGVSLMTVVAPGAVTGRALGARGRRAGSRPSTATRWELLGAHSATLSAWQVQGVAPCQHSGDGARPHGGVRPCNGAAPPPLVAPRPLRAPGGPAQRGDRPRVPLLLLRRAPPRREPPPRGRRAGPRQRHGTGGRGAPRDRRARGLHPADPLGPPQRRAPPIPAVQDQHVDAVPQPRLPRWHCARGGPGLPPPHPVGGVRRRHRLRPRDPGDRLGGGPQRDLLVRARRLPRRPRIPRPVRSRRARLRVGLDPGRSGRRGRGAPARRVRRALLAAHPGPAAGQPGNPTGGRTDPLPRRRPDHRPGRAPRPAVRGPHGRSGPAPEGGGLGRGQLVARRSVALGLRGRLQPLHLPGRPADGLRPGLHPGRHPHHPRWPRRGRVRVGVDDHRVRPDGRSGPLSRAGLPGGELLAPHPLRRAGLRLELERKATYRDPSGSMRPGPGLRPVRIQRTGPGHPPPDPAATTTASAAAAPQMAAAAIGAIRSPRRGGPSAVGPTPGWRTAGGAGPGSRRLQPGRRLDGAVLREPAFGNDPAG